MDSPENEKIRNKFLADPSGKCPDFRCEKEGKEMFVEIKKLTNLNK